MNKQQMIEVAEAALLAAKTAGASAARCVVVRSQNEKITMREGHISAYSPKTGYGIVLTVFCGARRATVKCLQSDPKGFAEIAREAVVLASFSSEHEFDGVPEPKYWPCAPSGFAALQAGLQNVENLPAPTFLDLAGYAEVFHNLGVSKEGVVRAEVTVSYDHDEKVLATSAGFSSYEEATSWSAYIELIGDEKGEVIAGGDGTSAYARLALRSPEDVVHCAHVRLEGRRGAMRPKSGRIHVVLDREVASRVIDTILEAMNAKAIYYKRTFLAEHIGERCFGERLTITSAQHVTHSLYAALVDFDGVATSDRVLVDHGVPTGWIGGYEDCRKIGIEPTGHASGEGDVYVEPGELSLPLLCAQFPRVLVVTDFNGRGFNEETGEVSVGIEGYILENGVRETVHEAVIAATMFEMLSGCIPANDVDPEGSIHSPSLYVGEMQLSGV